jgi:hypothetical protein
MISKEDIFGYIGIGIISIIFGAICINIILSKEQRYKYNCIRTYLLFFVIGIIIHLIVQTINLDQIYCDKKCQMRLKNNN